MADNDNNNIAGGMFKGLDKLINIASGLIDSSENIKRYSGEINSIDKNKIKTSYDVSIKLGLDEKIESLKTLSKNNYNRTRVEPNIDILDEEKDFIVIILVKNISENDIKIQHERGRIFFEAQNENVYYYKEINIPMELQINNTKWSYKNGIIKINITK